MFEMFKDPTFWVAMGFLAFVAVAGKKLYVKIAAGLDARADEIRGNLEEAKQLREQAQAALAQYQRQQRDAGQEAEAILTKAKEEAARLREAAEKRSEETVARREALALDRIAQAEAQALQDVREQTAEVAIAATGKLIGEAMTEAVSAAIVKDAIEELPKRLQ